MCVCIYEGMLDALTDATSLLIGWPTLMAKLTSINSNPEVSFITHKAGTCCWRVLESPKIGNERQHGCLPVCRFI